VEVLPQERKQIKTGIALEIPESCVGLIWDKSGLSHRHGIKTLGGVIDSGYRGEVMIGIINLSNTPYTFEKGHKVAQMIVQRIELVDIIEVEELTETERGDSGFGSTGK
jgi:dUTP pyrophosphatase